MKIDIAALLPAAQYKLLSATIVPRPIALVTTVSAEGRVNAAPFSFFNVMGEDPPVVVLGLQEYPDGSLKDTTTNIHKRGQFVVHMVDEDLADAMNVCGVRFPPEVAEVEHAGLAVVPCDRVAPPRIVAAPVAFECERIGLLQVSPGRHIAIGRAVMMHIKDDLIDPDGLYVDQDAYRPVGRLGGLLYTRTREHFVLPRPSYQEWLAGRDPAVAGRDGSSRRGGSGRS
jgi:flavin reductase (DIM6/NTAB) family NADH-FMN oxidoreductase RutF